MEKRLIKILFLSGLFISIFLNPISLKGQSYNDDNNRFLDNLNLNVSAGPTLYFGDIHSKSPFQEDWKMGFGFGLRKQFSPIFAVGLQFLSTKIHGTVINWPNGDVANLKFDSDLTEFNLHTTFNFSNAFFGFNPDRTLKVYALAGFGIANWMSTLRNTTDESVIEQYGVSPDGGNAWTPSTVFPVGLGVNITLTPNIGLNLESVYHIVNSDNLDAYTAGNGANDPFLFTSLGLSFKLSGSNRNFSSSSSASNFEKDLEKQRKYQQRVIDKEQKRQEREEADQARKKQIDSNKRGWGRKSVSANLPKVAEYDPQYSFRDQKNTTNKDVNSNIKEEDPPPSEIITIDEGKHFITGVKNSNLLAGNANQAIIVDNVNSNTLSTEVIQIPQTGIFYTVQIMASQKPATNIPDLRLKYFISKQIFVSAQNGVYRYSAGYFELYDDAVAYSKQLKGNGLTDAFVAIYQNGNRILYRPK
ncbi:MAG: hypothetical protein CVU00_01105 [Bacteroidetes bacterium HGW-Bacteroidetes-17]|nr:MAG: hypothetical protein CVU00_01105 [Bacteroidetes bacterium HGW-Bacteroidetes-17]